MSSFDTNVLNVNLTNPDVTYTSLSSFYSPTFFTATSTLSASNFSRNVTLSALYTSDININSNISSSDFTTIVTAMPTASAVDKSVHTTQTFFLTSIGVTHVELISAGTVASDALYGIAFNKLTPELTSLSATTTILSAYNGIKFKVNDAYNGRTMTLYTQNRNTYEFVVDISLGQTASQSLTASNSITPERRRLYTLGYI